MFLVNFSDFVFRTDQHAKISAPFCPYDFPYPYDSGFRCCWSYRSCDNGVQFGLAAGCCYAAKSVSCLNPDGCMQGKTGKAVLPVKLFYR
jgi:hypothetical protein